MRIRYLVPGIAGTGCLTFWLGRCERPYKSIGTSGISRANFPGFGLRDKIRPSAAPLGSQCNSHSLNPSARSRSLKDICTIDSAKQTSGILRLLVPICVPQGISILMTGRAMALANIIIEKSAALKDALLPPVPSIQGCHFGRIVSFSAMYLCQSQSPAPISKTSSAL